MQDSFKLHVNQHREVQNRVTVNSFAANFSGNGLRKKLNEHEKVKGTTFHLMHGQREQAT